MVVVNAVVVLIGNWYRRPLDLSILLEEGCFHHFFCGKIGINLGLFLKIGGPV